MILATDVGYSHTKAATDGRRAIFPSVLGEVQRCHLDLDLAQRNGYIQVETQDGQWLVGDGAIVQSGMRTRRQDRTWLVTPEYKALFLAAVTELTRSTNVTVQVITGLPIAYYGDREILRDTLMGLHHVARADRRAQRINVTDVLVLPQGLAAVLSEALDDKGKVRPGPISEGLVGLVDIGGHTVNVATFKELQEISRQTASVDAGLWGPLTDIRKAINRKWSGLALEDHDVVEAVRRGYIHYYGGRKDIADLAREPLKLFARRILAEASKVWGSAARLDVLLVAGGAAEVVGAAFLQEYPHARIVTEPQWANTMGFLKFGRRHYENLG